MRKRAYSVEDPFEYKEFIKGDQTVTVTYLKGLSFDVYIDPRGPNAHIVHKPSAVGKVTFDKGREKITTLGGEHHDKVIVWLSSGWPESRKCADDLVCADAEEALQQAIDWVVAQSE